MPFAPSLYKPDPHEFRRSDCTKVMFPETGSLLLNSSSRRVTKSTRARDLLANPPVRLIGWWICCVCHQSVDPAISLEQCPDCAQHTKCSACYVYSNGLGRDKAIEPSPCLKRSSPGFGPSADDTFHGFVDWHSSLESTSPSSSSSLPSLVRSGSGASSIRGPRSCSSLDSAASSASSRDTQENIALFSLQDDTMAPPQTLRSLARCPHGLDNRIFGRQPRLWLRLQVETVVAKLMSSIGKKTINSTIFEYMKSMKIRKSLHLSKVAHLGGMATSQDQYYSFEVASLPIKLRLLFSLAELYVRSYPIHRMTSLGDFGQLLLQDFADSYAAGHVHGRRMKLKSGTCADTHDGNAAKTHKRDPHASKQVYQRVPKAIGLLIGNTHSVRETLAAQAFYQRQSDDVVVPRDTHEVVTGISRARCSTLASWQSESSSSTDAAETGSAADSTLCTSSRASGCEHQHCERCCSTTEPPDARLCQQGCEGARRRVEHWVVAQRQQQNSPFEVDCAQVSLGCPSTTLDLSSVGGDAFVFDPNTSLTRRIEVYLQRTKLPNSRPAEIDEAAPLSLLQRTFDALFSYGPVTLGRMASLACNAIKAIGGSTTQEEVRGWLPASCCGDMIRPADFSESIETIWTKLAGAQAFKIEYAVFVTQLLDCAIADPAIAKSTLSAAVNGTYSTSLSPEQYTRPAGPAEENSPHATGIEAMTGNAQHYGNRRADGADSSKSGMNQRLQVEGDSNIGPQKSKGPMSLLPCPLSHQGCNGKDPHISEVLRKIESHHTYICGNCYAIYTSKTERRHHETKGCDEQCVLSECAKSQLSSLSSSSILAIRHKKGVDCPPAKGKAIQKWRYIYALCNPDCDNVPDPTILPGFKVPHNRTHAARRPIPHQHVRPHVQAQDEARPLLEEARTALANSEMKHENLKAELERTRTEVKTLLRAERAESKLESERSARTIETLINLLRLCKEKVKSEELRRQIDSACSLPTAMKRCQPLTDQYLKPYPSPTTRDLPLLEIDSVGPSASQSQHSGMSATTLWNQIPAVPVHGDIPFEAGLDIDTTDTMMEDFEFDYSTDANGFLLNDKGTYDTSGQDDSYYSGCQ